jgi:transcriptional regulator with XRE-family HTH domain
MRRLGGAAQQQRLADELRRLRALSGLTGRQLAQALDVDQSTISRIENAQQRVSIAQVVAWAKATEAPDGKQAELLTLAEDILVGPKSWEEASETGSDNLQRETREREAATGLLSIYMPAAVPGLLQTAAYARRVLSSGPLGVRPNLAEMVMDRMERQHILYDEAKRFRFVIPEAVLRWPYGPPDDPAVLDEHREQLARVGWALGRPNIEVRILPLAPVAVWRLSGFVIYDEVDEGGTLVHLELLSGPYEIDDPGQVETCRQVFANLLGASVTGDAARAMVQQAAEGLG